MNAALTRAEVIEVIRGHLAARDVDPAVVVDGASFVADIDLDSLDLQTLAQELEDEFGIRIGEADAVRLQTVGETVDFVLAARKVGVAR